MDRAIQSLEQCFASCSSNFHADNSFSSVQSLNHVQLFATPRTAARQTSLSITNSQSLLKLMSIESVMPSTISSSVVPLLLPPSIFPSISVFSNESVLRIRWPKYWSFSFSISPSNEYSGLISFRMDWLDLLDGYGDCQNFLWNEGPRVRVYQTHRKVGVQSKWDGPRQRTPYP